MVNFTLHVVLLLFSCQVVSDSLQLHGLAVLHYLLASAQIHIHRIGNAIQLSHPLSPHSPHALNLSQHWGLFQWVSSFHQVAEMLESVGTSASTSVLPMSIQGRFPLGLTNLISLQSKGLSRVFSSTIWKHQFFGNQPSLWFNSHIHTWLQEKS